MERELLEELGLKNRSNISVRTQLVGFCRLLNRGGKPEFFGVSRLGVPRASIKLSHEEALFIADIYETRAYPEQIEHLHKQLERYLNENSLRLSFLLYLNLRFLLDYIKIYPEHLYEFLN